jgi:Zn-dependent metalloprotease
MKCNISKHVRGRNHLTSLKLPCICFIIPEYMNKEIVEKGSKSQKARAWKNLVLTEQFRGRRQVTGLMSSMFAVSDKLYRTIYDAHNNENLPGTTIRVEGNSNRGGKVVSEAYTYSGDTYNFYKNIFERNSIDNNGMRLDSTVHYGEDYNNAFWNGTQMVYGDGDGEIFERFTKCVDVIGHELTHGITQYEAALNYQGQTGALNESFSDVFGSMIKQFILKQTVDKADWLIGKGLFNKKVKGVALRSMMEPGTAYDDPTIGKDPQPAHMKNYVKTSNDNGGVHINSGIPNRAFYLAAMKIGGFSWEKTGKIWYITLRDRMRENSNFSQAAKLTYDVAGNIYGVGSMEQKSVLSAWKEVGVEIKAKKNISKSKKG